MEVCENWILEIWREHCLYVIVPNWWNDVLGAVFYQLIHYLRSVIYSNWIWKSCNKENSLLSRSNNLVTTKFQSSMREPKLGNSLHQISTALNLPVGVQIYFWS